MIENDHICYSIQNSYYFIQVRLHTMILASITKKYIIVTRNITYGHLFVHVSMQFDITMEFYHIFMAQIGYLTVHCSMDNENYLK